MSSEAAAGKNNPAFDYDGERGYYTNPVTEPHPYAWLAPDMQQWVPGFPAIFRERKILDVGAGESLHGLLVTESYAPRLYVSLELIYHRLLATNARRARLPALALCCGDCYQLPFETGEFDLVVGNGVLHHLPDIAKVTAELGRVLKPGGQYVGREPNFLNPMVRRRVLGGHRSPNEHVLSAGDISAAFAQSGFTSTLSYFWRRLPWLHNRYLSVSMAIFATRWHGA